MGLRNQSATVGIDLGGTNARIAFVDDHGELQVIPDSVGRYSMRTDVFFDPSSLQPVVGEKAIALAPRQPEHLVRGVLRHLERDMSHVWRFGNRVYRPKDMCVLILRELKQCAEAYLDVPVVAAVIAVPSRFGSAVRAEIRRAGEEAGFQSIELLDALIAATMEVPLDGRADIPWNLLVCDLGGTSFDVGVVQVAGYSRSVRAVDGDLHLGGEAWDALLVAHTARRFEEQYGQDPRTDAATYLALFESARAAKEQLTVNQTASVVVSWNDISEEIHVNRSEFEQLSADLVAGTQAVLERALRNASGHGPHRLVLSGGGAWMPQLRRLVHEVTGLEPESGDPAALIVRGAALYGAEEESPDAAICIARISDRVYGIPIEDENGRPSLHVLVPQGTQLPVKVQVTFHLKAADPIDIPITVVACDREDSDPSGPSVRKVLDGAISELPRGLLSGHAIDLFFTFDDLAVDAYAEIDTRDGRYTCPLRHPTTAEHRKTTPPVTVDRIYFAVTAPHTVPPGGSFVIDVWAYFKHQRQQVVKRAREEASGRAISIKSKGPVRVARGTLLTVNLSVDHLVLHDEEDTILWEGEIGNASFPASVPGDAHEGTRQGTALIYVNGLRIARISFDILVRHGISNVGLIPAIEDRCRKAFACYDHDDRDAVLARVQGMLKAVPTLDVFLDVLTLRSGESWREKIWQVIRLSDVFYLFWSKKAANSEEVEREWRCALASRGLEFIDPVPLVSPEVVPPPPELSGKHFNDWVLAFMRTEGGP